MNAVIRRTLRILILLAVIILFAKSWVIIILFGIVGVLAGVFLALCKHFALKHSAFQNNNRFTHPEKPVGVPPGPSSHNEDFDIIIDSQTNKEYHIPKKKP